MKPASAYRAALYMRLSKEDDHAAESASISTQRKMLKAYAAENGYAIYDEYVDDGYSGTTFDRPSFMRMLKDIEAKRINLVITKDLSRFGREYITTGEYTERLFPEKGVRYIAVNDGYDSDSPYTDVAPFKNVMNEMYARDTSRKIRSAFLTKMRDGAYIAAFAPYGYQKDPADKHHLVVDAQSGEIVKRIFGLAASGVPPAGIARTLNGEGIPPPAVYRCMTRKGLDVDPYALRKEWTGATIAKMLQNVVYRGHCAQGKTTKASFKSHVTLKNPRDAWYVVENTHEALVDEESFDLARRHIAARTCAKKGTFCNLFSGLAKCADCGRSMSVTGTRKKGSPANLVCGGYKLCGADACSNHFIDYNALYEIVRASIREQLAISRSDRAALLENARRAQASAEKAEASSKAAAAAKKRQREIDRIIKKLYEDNAAGSLSDARLQKLLAQYEQEAKALHAQLERMERTQKATPLSDAEAREGLERALEKITSVEALTPTLLFKLIDRIEIGQGRYEKNARGKVKYQTVKIFYRFQAQETVKEYEAP